MFYHTILAPKKGRSKHMDPFPAKVPQRSGDAKYLCFTIQSSLLRGVDLSISTLTGKSAPALWCCEIVMFYYIILAPKGGGSKHLNPFPAKVPQRSGDAKYLCFTI